MNPLFQALASLQACASLDEARYLTAMQVQSAKGDDQARWWLSVLKALEPSEVVN